jgi:hypothetical protein
MGGGKGGGGGGGSSFSVGTSTTTLPDWVTNASQGALSTAQGLADRPYDPYSGQIVASPTDAQQQAYNEIGAMQGAYDPAYASAAGAQQNMLGNLQSLTPQQQLDATNQFYGNYGQQVLDPAQQYLGAAYGNAANLYGQALQGAGGLLGGYLSQGPASAQQIGANTQALMSPYASSVIDPTLQLGQRALAQNLQQVGAGANQVGAFGGSRQGVVEGQAQAQSALNSQQLIGNMLNSQWNASLNPATQVALQNAQEGYGAAGILGQMGYGAAGQLGQFGQSAASALNQMLTGGYGQAQQGAQNMLGTNLQLGETAAQQLPGIATAQQLSDQKNASLLQTVGAAQQQQTQNEINAQMGLHDQAQNWPVQNLDVLLSTLGAIPYGSTSNWTQYGTQQQTGGKNAMAGAAGGMLSGAATGAMFGPIGAGVGAVAGGILGGLG